jgi:hypothetical protein
MAALARIAQLGLRTPKNSKNLVVIPQRIIASSQMPSRTLPGTERGVRIDQPRAIQNQKARWVGFMECR